MKITVIAATGATGREVLTQTVERGDDVTAVVRSPQNLAVAVPHVKMDFAAPDVDALTSAFAGQDAVVSALGPSRIADAGIAAHATAALIEAVARAGVPRLVVISAAPVGTVASPAIPDPPRHDPGDGFVMRNLLNPIVKRVYRQVYADLARMEDDVRASGLGWTIVRPPQLVDPAPDGHVPHVPGRQPAGRDQAAPGRPRRRDADRTRPTRNRPGRTESGYLNGRCAELVLIGSGGWKTQSPRPSRRSLQ